MDPLERESSNGPASSAAPARPAPGKGAGGGRSSLAVAGVTATAFSAAALGTALAVVALGAGFAEARLGTPVSGPEHADSAPGASVPAAQSVEVPYNGDFTFTRIRYGRYGGFGRGDASWAHDYPDADRNMAMILKEFTAMHPNTNGSNVLDLEDPEIFRYPILYLSEPGFWSITEEGARNLREHLLKGGFIIFDDFDGPGHWENWLRAIQRALPEYHPVEIGPDHPIFDTFFYIPNIYVPHPMAGFRPEYYGIYEDNDPSRRMMALIVYNGDLAEYWEYAATGFFPVDPTSDSFRLGVNFFIYGLTR